MNATALIAEDEALLAADLQAQLAQAWPGLQLLGCAPHGAAAVQQALALRPDLLFLDIRMPGMSGLEAAEALAEDWPEDAGPLPLTVFVTAYDQYAVQAFEHAAVDYVLKPVQPLRLAQTCRRLQEALAARRAAAAAPDGGTAPALQGLLAQLQSLLHAPGLQGTGAGSASGPGSAPAPAPGPAAAGAGAEPLRVLQASVGPVLHLVPVAEVIYFEAADKYVRVVTAEREFLVRTSLRELQPRLDPAVFWQVHRSTIVRAEAIATAVRDDTGRLTLGLRGHRDTLTVSRLYAHLFRPM
ncbi:LytR/AlgR family response regulator transcription factor [Piscinibacter sakaiensis]|uniref:Transcriptional regulator protein n=1 Tax=Piscinibacter sakaiensis TaxID=1547922 RepID=A0A0K8P2G8_PISS1|nr:LytTR family DNA-binding domain-containing protein [Piscinibacter sakaiensis]GAP36813.1 transcriptional regulator protein [Piscinibacter sakaiensis]